ncbi:hypothetical protein NPIL_111771 [Nephila pilipes]|uniref:Uncharacterized protein n=1 Tax=Nephila pilipes TaxID=299642 RepID=A0A8X6QXA8_NEPPI|nr:hypothetical protein NPIL_111771 [Nephila pilipes]
MKIFQVILHSFASEIQQTYHFSSATLSDWRQFNNEVILDYIENNSQKIGSGKGRIMEVNKSKFGLKNRSHLVERLWFLEVFNEYLKGIFSCSSRQILRHYSGMDRVKNNNLLRQLEGL